MSKKTVLDLDENVCAITEKCKQCRYRSGGGVWSDCMAYNSVRYIEKCMTNEIKGRFRRLKNV